MKKILKSVCLLGVMAFVSSPLFAADSPTLTVEQIYAQQDQLAGKRVQFSGEVVKVNNGIMRRNFLHIKDGTGKAGKTDDLTVTSNQTAQVGDKLKIDALVTQNRDFGMGYNYPLILEEAKLTPVK